MRGLPFCVSLCSSSVQRAYVQAMKHSDSSQLATLIAEQVDHAWEQFFVLSSSALHLYYQDPSASPQDICNEVMAKETEKKQKAAACCVCDREEASVVLRCCDASIHMSCLINAYDSRTMSLKCPHCPSIVRESEYSTDNSYDRRIETYYDRY